MSIDWTTVYRETFPGLVRFLHRKVWDPERARDLAQEAFVRALREQPEKPRAWLFQVAANLARDEARTSIRRREHLTVIQGGLSEADPAPGPLEAAADSERKERVRAALARLSERDREVLTLWDAGLDYAEIAERAGLAPGAVGTTLARARKRLVAAFESEEGDHAAEG
ncbi:RNA polymerase sigma factor [Gaopeijia maritima]|uniref:Sigma-70 family RNA polymerase sigma factor n=1 Tax=Gaopeijia maritima TaxID=3119007 RepID=A0ABU9ECL7_9BACT